MFIIEAIVCDPSGVVFGGDYYKVIARSTVDNADVHMSRLTEDGYRVLSVKVRPATTTEAVAWPMPDRQGNQTIVDGKPVIVEDENDAVNP